VCFCARVFAEGVSMCVGPPSFDPFGAFHKCSHKSGFSWPRIDFLTFVAAFFRRFSRFSFFSFFSLFHFLSLAFLSRILYRISLACCLLACLPLAFKNILCSIFHGLLFGLLAFNQFLCHFMPIIFFCSFPGLCMWEI